MKIIPLVYLVCVSGICFYVRNLWGTSLKLMLLHFICYNQSTSHSPLHPKGTRAYFHSSLFIIIPSLFKLQLGSHYTLWGTILAIAGHQGTMQYAKAIIYKIPSRKRSKNMELEKRFLFCIGTYTVWKLNSTNSSLHRSFINIKVSFYCVK